MAVTKAAVPMIVVWRMLVFLSGSRNLVDWVPNKARRPASTGGIKDDGSNPGVTLALEPR